MPAPPDRPDSTRPGPPVEQASACLSDDGRYRYQLDRWWASGDRLVWVMLNPSTADAAVDDPTIRRVRGFTRREGYDGFVVVNLFALRATNPAQLTAVEDPEGPANRDRLAAILNRPVDVVVAWGANPAAVPMADLIRTWRPDARSLGHTKAGAPRHPLYVRRDQPLTAAWPTSPTADPDPRAGHLDKDRT